jgi:hypothetical protein
MNEQQQDRKRPTDRNRPCTEDQLAGASTRELTQRLTGAVEVALLWLTGTDCLWVSVRDASGGVDFRLEVDPAEAMEVFHHPYAYAASRGIQYGGRNCAEAEAVDV